MNSLLAVVLGASLAPAAGCRLLDSSKPNVNLRVRGTIEASDLRLPDGSRYDKYPLELEAGWTVHAAMASGDFDTFLILMDPDGNRAIHNDDDPTQRRTPTNSQFTYTTTMAGTYQLYADAYEEGQAGGYELAVQAGPPDALPPAPVLTSEPLRAPAPAAPAPAPAPAAPAAPAPAAPAPAAPAPTAPAPAAPAAPSPAPAPAPR